MSEQSPGLASWAERTSGSADHFFGSLDRSVESYFFNRPAPTGWRKHVSNALMWLGSRVENCGARLYNKGETMRWKP